MIKRCCFANDDDYNDYDDDTKGRKLISEESIDDRSQFYNLLPNLTLGNISLRSLVLQNECPLNYSQ
jgi:hypothetical protein